MTLRLKFDSNQSHQISAIESTLKVFYGMSAIDTRFELGEDIIPNLPEYHHLEENWLFENLLQIQQENKIQTSSMHLVCEDGMMLEGIGTVMDSWRYPHFTIEMETGTGKTYVYLRTIHELRKNYGFRKFIIIVPSVAIYEGVLKSFQITHSHFRSLYSNEIVHLTPYSGQHISKLRGFASSSFTEILLMTIDSFNKTSNNLYKATEKLPGERLPYEYIQETRPILILDECQNYRSEKSKEALRTLKPLFSLNYSATPIDKPNLIYVLTPVDSFKQNLVKKIEVLGVTEQYNLSDPQLNFQVKEFREGYGLGLEWTIETIERGKPITKTISIKKGDNLGQKSGIESFNGIEVQEINKGEGFFLLSSGEKISLNEPIETTHSKKEIFRAQIENTIKYHFEKQAQIIDRGIKVLTLFFIDRVANYMNEDGIIKVLFDELFERLKSQYNFFKDLKAEEIRNGYFAKKQKKGETDEYIDTHIEDEEKTKAEKELEKEAYKLIMKEKERLLSFDEKLCFIFAHSALKEGWDNPNVFQICTLNQTRSEIKKRQEIGRGMRLAVNQNGERVMGDDINILTVVANESYESYVSNLQTEYVETGDIAPPRPTSARKVFTERNDRIYSSNDFKRFWKRLCQKTDYKLNVNTNAFIIACVNKLEQTQFPEPQLVISKGRFIITEIRITLLEVKAKLARIEIVRTDTDGSESTIKNWFSNGKDLARILKDRRLKGYKIVEIILDSENSKVIFSEKGELNLNETFTESSEKGQVTDQKAIQESQTTYPVPNIIERAAKETYITRSTLSLIHISEPTRLDVQLY